MSDPDLRDTEEVSFKDMSVRETFNRSLELFTEGGIHELYRGIKDFITLPLLDKWSEIKRHWYLWRIGPVVKKEIQGSLFELDLTDPGISSDLFFNDIREPVTTKSYQKELKRLSEASNSGLTVVDIGANIGYYAFMPLTIDKNSNVIAIEIEDSNVKKLRNNAKLNNYLSSIDIIHTGVGASQKVEKLVHSDSSNLHSIKNAGEIEGNAKDVKVKPLTKILEDRGISYEQVDVIRMDVEGYEAEVIRGMLPLFDQPLLLNVELHPNTMREEDIDFVLSILEESNAEIISAARDSDEIEIDEISNLSKFTNIEIVAMTHGR